MSTKTYHINQSFAEFVSSEILPQTKLEAESFWTKLDELIAKYAGRNEELLETRRSLQHQIDQWHLDRAGQKIEMKDYHQFLKEIGYIVDEGEDFSISTNHVDEEISTIAGPQLVVPVKNARFALNAANARWGSLYDSLYGTDAIPHTSSTANSRSYNPVRGRQVVEYSKTFLDEVFPLQGGASHRDVVNYSISFRHLLVTMSDKTVCGLGNPAQFVAFSGSKESPTSIVLKNNGLHVELDIAPHGKIGRDDPASIDDILVEAAVTTIMDFEDSVAAVDSEDKVEAYRNWLGLMTGNLESRFVKNGVKIKRCLQKDRSFKSPCGYEYALHGRSLLLARNVGHLMKTDLLTDQNGNPVPEGIIDTVITALIGSIDLAKSRKGPPQPFRNSRTGSIYIVKPKMHGPEEVRFTCDIFSAVEELLDLPALTLKLGIMDEERRTTVNLKECIRVAKDRVVFINTGFLDRTGDEIHTSMEAGPFLPKAQIKDQPWISAYEDWNVDIGLACGLQGRAQIGKGMWAMPDEMNRMLKEKIAHPRAGSNTAWVPSPSAAVLHALHYHKVDVFAVQESLKERRRASLSDILTIPLMTDDFQLTETQVETELENNIQGILGYVVRWIELGIGCSKVPDINNIGLMEDRATLRISCQHIANWLHHDICTIDQVQRALHRMAQVVDKQNEGVAGYVPMTPHTGDSIAFQAASKLVLAGKEQPNGYTEPLLHHYRSIAKSSSNSTLPI